MSDTDHTERHDAEEERTLFRRAAAPAAEDDPLLHVLDIEAAEGMPARRVTIGPGPLAIGRTAVNGLVLPSADVSRTHCVIALEDGVAVVTDLGSTNGTVVDGVPADGKVRLAPGARLRLGPFTLTYRSGRSSDLARADSVERDLARAGRYVRALLPEPLTEGRVLVDWRFLPSANVGGDGFGYGWLDDDRFALWLIDVAGHGVDSALHAAAAMNILRAHGLPGIDFGDPAAVLSAVNARFQMDSHSGLFFSLWYGVCDLTRRRLVFGCAGHHPAFLLRLPGTAPEALFVKSPAIGFVEDWPFACGEASLPPGARLQLFSDGAFEVIAPDGRQLVLQDFAPYLLRPEDATEPEPERLLSAVRSLARPGALDDDVSILTFDFP